MNLMISFTNKKKNIFQLIFLVLFDIIFLNIGTRFSFLIGNIPIHVGAFDFHACENSQKIYHIFLKL